MGKITHIKIVYIEIERKKTKHAQSRNNTLFSTQKLNLNIGNIRSAVIHSHIGA